MKTLVDKIFDGEEIKDEDYNFFNFITKSDEGQWLFRAHLNNKRKEKKMKLSELGFQQLKALMWNLLDYL